MTPVLPPAILAFMDTGPSPQPKTSGGGPLGPSPGAYKDVVRFWELRRIAYNGVLAVVVILWVAVSWPHFRPAFTWESLLFLIFAAALANLCYCAAYLVEFPMHTSAIRSGGKRWRWTVWLLGTVFAVVVANYWIADEIYPFVR